MSKENTMIINGVEYKVTKRYIASTIDGQVFQSDNLIGSWAEIKPMVKCHCGKDGHALNSINCPVHGRREF